jgi:two-component system NtrC family response regulator
MIKTVHKSSTFVPMKKGNILIIDDEEKLRNLFGRIIKSEGFEVFEAADCKSALKKIAQGDIDVILSDVKLPDGNGVNLIQEIKSKTPFSEIILLTAYGNIPDGIQAMKNGAFDYLVKGDDNEKIIPLIYRAIEKAQLKKRVIDLEKKVNEKFSFHSIIGKSKAIQQAIDMAQKVAVTDTAVLLIGETGSGKEVFAEAIHQSSKRAGMSLVAFNCSTFSKEIVESELFGYKEGAFTGANKNKKGLIEEAHGGTLFLDEIGEMPLELQAKLLRVLETNEFIKLGDTKPTKSDFRLITATNKDLKSESEEHRFRADLYFRLSVFTIPLPPLRDRIKDIEPLANYFIKQFAINANKKSLTYAPAFLKKLEAYHWPGNIRELKNVIERCVILTDNDALTTELLPFEIQVSERMANKQLSAFSMASAEKLQIQKLLNYTKGNKAETARLLEIGIATLYRKMEEFGL